MLIYGVIGALWSWWLENFTTNNLNPESYGRPWVWRERVFHILLWPWSLGTFIYATIKEFNKRN